MSSGRILRLDNVHAFYGKSHVLHGVSLQVNPGEIVSLLGRNGAGRSTTVKTIMGQVDAKGSVKFGDAELVVWGTGARGNRWRGPRTAARGGS